MRKDALDFPGFAALFVLTVLLGVNQIFMKLTGAGLSPMFQAALRSVFAALVILIWMLVRRVSFASFRNDVGPGLMIGTAFTLEFIGLYNALDMTTVSRASIIFYSMPMHLSLAAHFLIPGERLTGVKILGLICAFLGVVIVLSDRPGGEASLAGDLLALLGALGWAAIALIVRVTRISEAPAEAQQLWQLSFSAVTLMALAPLFGPLVRDFEPVHVAYMAFQVLAVASFGYLAWFGLLKRYPAAIVASFSFLTPVFAVLLGWLLLGEELHLSTLVSLIFVSLGIVLINRRAR